MILVSGIAVVDLISSGLERVARPGELVFGSVRTNLGGHACNVSVDLVRLGVPASKVRVVFPAGQDLFGEFLVNELRDHGLRPEPLRARRAPTSLDLILVARGEDRRYHADPGANLEMEIGPVERVLKRDRPDILYAGGVGLLGRFDDRLAALLKGAKRLGALTFVDAVTPYRRSWEFLKRALPWTDIYHGNADEAASLTGEKDPVRAVERVRRMGAGQAFVTMGGEGVLARVSGALLTLPAFSVRAVDPTGAGDAFSAGLLLKLQKMLDRGLRPEGLTLARWLDALVFASACGAVCVTGVGTTTALSARKVTSLVRAQGKKILEAASITPRPERGCG